MRNFLFLLVLIVTLFQLWLLTSCKPQHKGPINMGGFTWSPDTTIVIDGADLYWPDDTITGLMKPDDFKKLDSMLYIHDGDGDSLMIQGDSVTGFNYPKFDHGIDPPLFDYLYWPAPQPRADTVNWLQIFEVADSMDLPQFNPQINSFSYLYVPEPNGKEVLRIDEHGKLHVTDSLTAIQMLIKNYIWTYKYYNKEHD